MVINCNRCSFNFPFASKVRLTCLRVYPIAFHLGSLPCPLLWSADGAGFFLAGLVTATRRARLVNVHADIIADVTLWLMIGGIIGARVVYVTTY